MSSNEDDDENENDNENENYDDDDDDDDDDDEIMSQNEENIRMKDINDNLDEIIDKSKSFDNQIKSIKK